MSSQKRHTSKKVKERQKQKRIEKQLQKQLSIDQHTDSENIKETVDESPAEDNISVNGKKHSVFSIFLLCYTLIILLCGAGLLKYLWSRLDTFQINYETAKANANPDLVIGDYLDLFRCDDISAIQGNEWDEISSYETDENIDAFIRSNVSDDKIRWERRTDFSDLKPKYDIYSENNYIGAMALKQKNAVDAYGFHMCELDKAEVGFAPENLKSIVIKAYDGTNISVNGMPLEEQCIETKEIANSIDKEASEETGIVYKINTYELTGFLEYPDVRIERTGYICDMDVNKDENDVQTYSQIKMYEPECLEEISGRVLEIAKAYDMYAAGRREIGGMGAYFIYSGKGYRMLSGLAFDISIAGTTTVYDILSADTGNLLMYSPEDAVIDTYQSIHRVHRNIEYNENIDMRWYLKKINGRWMVKDFSMRL